MHSAEFKSTGCRALHSSCQRAPAGEGTPCRNPLINAREVLLELRPLVVGDSIEHIAAAAGGRLDHNIVKFAKFVG